MTARQSDVVSPLWEVPKWITPYSKREVQYSAVALKAQLDSRARVIADLPTAYRLALELAEALDSYLDPQSDRAPQPQLAQEA